MNVSNGTQSSRAPKLKAAAAPSSDIVIDDSSQNDQDVKNPPRYVNPYILPYILCYIVLRYKECCNYCRKRMERSN